MKIKKKLVGVYYSHRGYYENYQQLSLKKQMKKKR